MIAKIIDFLDKLGLDKRKMILFIIASLVIICIDAAFIIKAQINGLKSSGTQIAKLKKDIDALNKGLVMMQKPQAKQGGILKKQKLISEGEMPLLLGDISNTANKFRIKIMQIIPVRDLKAKEETIGENKFLPVAITLNLYCNYHSLGNFINALENSGAFIAVQEMKIMRSSSDYLSQEVTLKLKTYVKR